MRTPLLLLSLWAVAAGVRADLALNLEVEDQRQVQPFQRRPTFETGVTNVLTTSGDWCYGFRVTEPWQEGLPQWPSVNLTPAVTDWSAYDRLVLDIVNDAFGGDGLYLYLAAPTGRVQNGLSAQTVLPDFGYSRWVVSLTDWPATQDPSDVGRVHLYLSEPLTADFTVGGFYLLRPEEALPEVPERFRTARVALVQAKRDAALAAVHARSVASFVSDCRAVGQDGTPCWVGAATSMEKIRPRDEFTARPAQEFALSLARGETEALQVLVLPNGATLTNVSVSVSGFPFAASFTCAPVGYVKTVNEPPYMRGFNIATNLPGGYLRQRTPTPVGWWPDPILSHLGAASVSNDDVQAFWVRLTCPTNTTAGTYRGTLRVAGEGWRKEFPFRVRVYGFALPKESPLPLAVTFAPGTHTDGISDEERTELARHSSDMTFPVQAWKTQTAAWDEFLAAYYLTRDSLYHGGQGIAWEALTRQQAEGRLGRFNLGYWNYPKAMDAETLARARAVFETNLRPNYLKARELGILDHAYLYGCDEVSSAFFPNIRWAIAQLKELFPEVPLSTTAYDETFGSEEGLAGIDWFTPTTDRYVARAADLAAARARGKQVWWYIACGQKAPLANIFIEGQGIEPRILMGAQAAKWRPDGFLYYQTSLWNAVACIDGTSTFTEWNPRSWTNYHGDGSLFCVGPGGAPCATIRAENFRDGLEDLAYVREYERVTGRTCEVPVSVCRALGQYTDDPAALLAWRESLAQEIERHSADRRNGFMVYVAAQRSAAAEEQLK